MWRRTACALRYPFFLQTVVKRSIFTSMTDNSDSKHGLEEDTSVRKRSRVVEPSAEAPAELKHEGLFGITEYTTTFSGFSGILKDRYSDFLVNELDLNGHICHLTDLQWHPPEPVTEDLSAHRNTLESLIGTQQLKGLEELADPSSSNKAPLELALENDTKDNRKAVHLGIRSVFPILVSEAKQKSDKTIIFVQLASKQARGSRRTPSDRSKPYTHFLLGKENKDTLECISILSSLLHTKKRVFTMAGTKDKRGVTVQRISAQNIPPERLAGLNSRLQGFKVGNFSLETQPLKLGQLRGNRFDIIIRNVNLASSELGPRVEAMSLNGFVNYFGLQRFGTSSVPTYKVGCALLCSDWAEAINLILRPRENDVSESAEARQIYARGNIKEALNKMPTRSYIEKSLLSSLCRYGSTEYTTALSQLPRTMRMMYVHSFQSFIWNHMVSLRLQRFGLTAMPGDLVYMDEGAVVENTEVTADVAEAGNEEEEGEEEDYKVPEESFFPLPAVKVLTEETAKLHSIFDVVLPLPGFLVTYPQNLETEYIAAMEKEGVKPENLKHRVKDYSLVGAYRKLLGKPLDVEWAALQYTDRLLPLVETDLDRVRGGNSRLGVVADGALTALRLSFTLTPSSYATMVIRELLKADTSAAFQASLTAIQSKN